MEEQLDLPLRSVSLQIVGMSKERFPNALSLKPSKKSNNFVKLTKARTGNDRALVRTGCRQHELERSRTMQNRERSTIFRQTDFGINSGEDAPAMHTDFNQVTDADWRSVVNEIRTLRDTFSRLLSLSDSLGKILEVSKNRERTPIGT
jgi:hypothetical protein